jgi:hypothetical protein
MATALEDSFTVFIRSERQPDQFPEAVERELVTCSSYEEAEWVRLENEAPGRKCIIRYVGPAGGGD